MKRYRTEEKSTFFHSYEFPTVLIGIKEVSVSMKKKLFVIVTSLMLLLTGCGSQNATASAAAASSAVLSSPLPSAPVLDEPEYKMVLNDPASLPEDAENAFKKALSDDSLVMHRPVALLATQVVAGTNYLILYDDVDTMNELTNKGGILHVTEWPVFVEVYEDLDGNASVLNSAKFDLADYTGKENHLYAGDSSEQMTGAFEVSTDYDDAIAYSGDLLSVFTQFDKDGDPRRDKAVYTPVALLGVKTDDSSTKSVFLVQDQYPDGQVYWAFATVIQAGNDAAPELLSVYELDPAAIVSGESSASSTSTLIIASPTASPEAN